MNKIKKLSNAFSETLSDSELQNVTIDLAETFTDSLLDDGLLKDIPIIGTIVGLTKASINFSDRLLIKKLLYFLSELKDIDQSKRKKLISKIDNSNKQKIKVGEKLLYIIDKCDDHLTAKYIAILFKAFLNEKIDYDEFTIGTKILEKIPVPELKWFINKNLDEMDLEGGGSEYVSYGLMEISLTKPKIKISNDKNTLIENYELFDVKDLENKISINNFEIKAKITYIGEIIREILKEEF